MEVAKRVFMDDPGGQRFGLAPIELANKSDFDPAFGALSQPLSDYTFACNYIWGACLKLYWLRSDRHVCIFANGTGDLTLLLPPLPLPGATDADMRDCLGRCFDIMDAYNDVHADRSHSRVEYVSDELLERISAATVRGPLNLGASPMSGDYIYDMARMIDLAGGGLKSKRHARSKFLREHPDARTEPYTHAHLQGCLDLLGLWQHHGDEVHQGEVNEDRVGSDVLRNRDTIATRRALEQYDVLGLTGMVLIADEKIIGLTLGEALQSSQASILIEKTHHDYDGSAQFIFSEFCRQYWPHLPWCNAGDDWGLPHLRFTKQSYRPVRILNKAVLTRSSMPIIVGHGSVTGFTPAIIDQPRMDVHVDAPAPVDMTREAMLSAGSTESAHEATPQAMLEQVMTSSIVNAGDDHSHDASSDQPVIGPAMPCDLDAILSLELACFDSPEERFGRRQVRMLLQNPRATVLVARLASTQAGQPGRVVGWTCTLIRHDRAGKVGRIYAIAVHPDMQGRRLGSMLLEQGLRRLVDLAPRRIALEVRQGNHHAIALYEKIGFTQAQFLPDYYGHGRHGYRMACPTHALIFQRNVTTHQTSSHG